MFNMTPSRHSSDINLKVVVFFLNPPVYVCVCVYIYMCVYLCVCVYLCIYKKTHACVYLIIKIFFRSEICMRYKFKYLCKYFLI